MTWMTDTYPAHAASAWPIDYETLAPFYEQAEGLLGVRSFAVEADLQKIATAVVAIDYAWSLRVSQHLLETESAG